MVIQQVHDNIYRSAQPTATDWPGLKDAGIQSIIKLNLESEGSDLAAADLGIIVHEFPIPPYVGNTMSMIERIDPRIVEAAITTALSAKVKSLIHCTHGKDRTSFVCAQILVLEGVMTPDQAWHYMLENGFHPEIPNLVWAWHEFTERVSHSRS